MNQTGIPICFQKITQTLETFPASEGALLIQWPVSEGGIPIGLPIQWLLSEGGLPIQWPVSEGGLPIQWPASPPSPHTSSPVFSILSNNQSSHEDDQLSLPASTEPSSGKEVGDIIQATVGKRRKKDLWTEEEHRNFLRGMELYGKGKWKIIAEQAVKTKTPSQVASHAQKFFLRQKLTPDKRKRLSIHDITDADVISEPQKQPQQLPVATPIGLPTPFSPQQPQHPMAPTAHTAAPVESQDIPMTSSAPVPDQFSLLMNAHESDDLLNLFDWERFENDILPLPSVSHA